MTATLVVKNLSAGHGDRSLFSGLDLVVAWVTHDRLHLHQIVGTLARAWAERWAPHRAAYAGPIPYEGVRP